MTKKVNEMLLRYKYIQHLVEYDKLKNLDKTFKLINI